MEAVGNDAILSSQRPQVRQVRSPTALPLRLIWLPSLSERKNKKGGSNNFRSVDNYLATTTRLTVSVTNVKSPSKLQAASKTVRPTTAIPVVNNKRQSNISTAAILTRTKKSVTVPSPLTLTDIPSNKMALPLAETRPDYRTNLALDRPTKLTLKAFNRSATASNNTIRTLGPSRLSPEKKNSTVANNNSPLRHSVIRSSTDVVEPLPSLGWGVVRSPGITIVSEVL